ncbi:hypothetical protein O0I10_004259 [Lichtheimia ornata]|uniref:Uncharacterized protein n=1 Tax=Lichtheimia ornata TaxID=688661 RepID=A0AAD7V8U2_9FUNG|nr:uncharacterized protein O0I10_004259 [Lichtheimia ornata]KAJ8660032.1 hypothetical protein O0I10_004259 [Lichtheimia ornata]
MEQRHGMSLWLEALDSIELIVYPYLQDSSTQTRRHMRHRLWSYLKLLMLDGMDDSIMEQGRKHGTLQDTTNARQLEGHWQRSPFQAFLIPKQQQQQTARFQRDSIAMATQLDPPSRSTNTAAHFKGVPLINQCPLALDQAPNRPTRRAS